jgi:hypothetical protein
MATDMTSRIEEIIAEAAFGKTAAPPPPRQSDGRGGRGVVALLPRGAGVAVCVARAGRGGRRGEGRVVYGEVRGPKAPQAPQALGSLLVVGTFLGALRAGGRWRARGAAG